MEDKKNKDTLIKLFLRNPHVCDFIWQRPDGTCYADRRNHGQSYQECYEKDGEWIFVNVIDKSQTNHN